MSIFTLLEKIIENVIFHTTFTVKKEFDFRESRGQKVEKSCQVLPQLFTSSLFIWISAYQASHCGAPNLIILQQK